MNTITKKPREAPVHSRSRSCDMYTVARADQSQGRVPGNLGSEILSQTGSIEWNDH